MSRTRSLTLLALALFAAPALAYTIYLKDGSRIIAREKYTVKGERAILILESGTRSSMPFDEIDIPRTDKANETNVGTAIVFEDGKAVQLERNAAQPPAQPRLQDLIRSNSAGVRDNATAPAAAPSVLPAAVATQEPKRSSRPTEANIAHPDPGLAGELRGFVTARGITAVQVYRGADDTHPRLVFGTGSEGAVFKALLVSANALLHFQSVRPTAVQGIEIECESSDGGLGARLLLNPQQASDIVTGRTEITRFFVENVQF